MASNGVFNYSSLLKETTEEWKQEVIHVFRCMDAENEGSLPRDSALHAMKLFGMNGEEYFKVKEA